MENKKNILIGLALACIPIPVVLHGSVIDISQQSFFGLVMTNLILMGVPALFLLFGYQQTLKTRRFTRTSFLKASAVVGIALGLFVIIPLALPLIYYRGTGVPAHLPVSQLVGILSLLTFWSILCAAIFWGVAISPHLTQQGSEGSEAKA